MSHFTVGVILENPKGDNAKLQRDLEKALAPFQENNNGDCSREYLEFHSATEECREDYETGTITKVRLKDGSLVSPYDERFRIKGTMGTCISSDSSRASHVVPDDLEQIEVPYKELFQTFEEYMEKYENYYFDEEMQDYGYWENPNAKWDWWYVGGRWRDNLLVKGEEYLKGERSFFDLSDDKEAPDGYTWASGGIIKDIDLKKTMQGKYEKAIRFWEIVVEGKPLKEGEELSTFYKTEYFIDRYGTKENYAEQESTFHTYALIIDGKWLSEDDMGWFGLDDSTKERKATYLEKFKEIMNAEENQDKFFVLIDCHI